MKRRAVIIGAILFVGVFVTAILLNDTYKQLSPGGFSGILDVDNGDTKINWSRFESFDVELKNEALNITKSGVYHLTGALNGQNVVVNVIDGKVKLILDHVAIYNPNGPAILCQAADDLVIELKGENILSDGKTYAASYDENVTGVIYSKSDLTFDGDGMLILNAKYQDGIVGKDDVKFNSGTYNISAVDDAIRGEDSVYIVDGNFTINAKGDGIKVSGSTKPGKGFVLIRGGNIYIAGSVEGIEGHNVYIAGGNLNITSSDDGINAGSSRGMLEFTGGKTYINASGDGVDSNGRIHFGGGTVIIDGPANNRSSALDSNLGITQTGGIVIAVGSSAEAKNIDKNSSAGNLSITLDRFAVAGTEIEVKDSNGRTIISHTAAKPFDHIIIGTPELKTGEEYTIYINGEKHDIINI